MIEILIWFAVTLVAGFLGYSWGFFVGFHDAYQKQNNDRYEGRG